MQLIDEKKPAWGASLLALAATMPGVLSAPTAHAEALPETGLISLKYLDYRERQPGANRMHVTSPSVFAMMPIAGKFVLEGTFTTDSMSGASPIYHSTLSGASGRGVRDFRRAGDVKASVYNGNQVWSVGAAVSSERDYLSRAISLDARISTEDNNTTFAFGISHANDSITSENGVADHEKKRTTEALVGITRVLSPQRLLQSNVTIAKSNGYMSDPYKPFDQRPDHRTSVAWLTRLNQYVASAGGALAGSYRLYHDTYGVTAHTLEAQWRQPINEQFTLAPLVRYYTQSKAKFYGDPPWPQGRVRGEDYSADQRLSAFGSFALGLRADLNFAQGWGANAKVETFEQRSSWRLGGNGSPGLLPFRATSITVGLSKTL